MYIVRNKNILMMMMMMMMGMMMTTGKIYLRNAIHRPFYF
jgi:hypothetical protein